MKLKQCDTSKPCTKYAVRQRYDSYTKSEHEVWRIALTALVSVLESRCAVPYLSSLRACGLTIERLPRLAEIRDALRRFGWNAVMVDSFIPTPAFMVLQAQCTLPITHQVRSASQAGYTPIPDIVHEAAGHLPMLVDSEYRRFLKRFGYEGQRLRYSALDRRIYEAQKSFAEYLSSSNQDPVAVQDMQAELEALRQKQQDAVTPACMVARFQWWTIEYGLIGPHARLYGAGLLSSSSEALATSETPKLALSLDCLNFDYEISRPQPQLFVTEDWVHLNDQLDQLVEHVS